MRAGGGLPPLRSAELALSSLVHHAEGQEGQQECRHSTVSPVREGFAAEVMAVLPSVISRSLPVESQSCWAARRDHRGPFMTFLRNQTSLAVQSITNYLFYKSLTKGQESHSSQGVLCHIFLLFQISSSLSLVHEWDGKVGQEGCGLIWFAPSSASGMWPGVRHR